MINVTVENTITKHFEVHLITNSLEADLALLAGLPEVPYDLTECFNCESAIGRAPALAIKFIPLTIVLGEDDDGHLLCLSCSAPVCAPKA